MLGAPVLAGRGVERCGLVDGRRLEWVFHHFDREPLAAVECFQIALHVFGCRDILRSGKADSLVGRGDRRGGDRGILYHHRRRFSEGDLIFLVNTSLDQPTSGRIETARGGVERWDPATGETGLPYPFTVLGEAMATEFDLPPGGSLLLFFPDERRQPEPQREVEWSRVPGADEVTVVRDAPNVLTLDYVDVTVDGETQTDQYFYAAARAIFRAHGMEENPWDHAVQFGDELISNDGRSWDTSWNPVWSAGAVIDSIGWTAELRIPFSQLRFSPGEDQVWGLNVPGMLPSRRGWASWKYSR